MTFPNSDSGMDDVADGAPSPELMRWSYWTPANEELERVSLFSNGNVARAGLHSGAATEALVGYFAGAVDADVVASVEAVLAARPAAAPTLPAPAAVGQWWATWADSELALVFAEPADETHDAWVSQLLALRDAVAATAIQPVLGLALSAELLDGYPALTLRSVGTDAVSVRIGAHSDAPGPSFVTMGMETLGYVGRFFEVPPGETTWAVLDDPAAPGDVLAVSGELSSVDALSAAAFSASVVVTDPPDAAGHPVT